MQLLAIDYEAFGFAIGCTGLFLTLLFWWLAKLLNDKKDITILQEQVKNLKEELDEVKEELKEWRQRKIQA